MRMECIGTPVFFPYDFLSSNIDMVHTNRCSFLRDMSRCSNDAFHLSLCFVYCPPTQDYKNPPSVVKKCICENGNCVWDIQGTLILTKI